MLVANLRYWPTIYPRVAVQLRRWKQLAGSLEAAEEGELALGKLADERFNAEVAATLATLAPRRYRARTTEALVAYEVLYDYLDGLTEQPLHDPIADGRRLYEPFEQALTADRNLARPSSSERIEQSDVYAGALSTATRTAFATLPRAHVVGEVARRAARRCAEAQTRTHAVDQLGRAQLEEWAQQESYESGLPWRVFLAGSMASVLCVHALISAAAKAETTPAEAHLIDRAYLSICAISTMLDSVVDYDSDVSAHRQNFLAFYESAEEFQRDLSNTALLAIEQARSLRHGKHHTMMLAGVLAYYLSAPGASRALGGSVSRETTQHLDKLLDPTLRIMRTWRIAKKARSLTAALPRPRHPQNER